MKRKITILLGILALNTSIFAQFEIQGIIRPRFEFRNGYGTLRNDSTNPATFISQRTRLNFKYKNDKIEFKISLYDYRVWGDEIWKKDLPAFGTHEAWAKYKINKNLSVKFGRQELKYDNSRLISAVNWNQIGAAHDAVFLNYKKNTWKANLVTAWNQSQENKFGTDYAKATSFYKSLNIFFLQKKIQNITVSTLNIADGKQDLIDAEKLHFRITSGLKINYKKDKLNVIGRAFIQKGKLQNNQNINAFFTNIDFIYSPNKNLHLNFGNEIKSGNNALDTLNTTSNAFDILYGARKKLNGHISYFSIPSTTKNAGLIDTYLKTNYNFSKLSKLLVEYHYFTLQNNYIVNNKSINKFLAHELDFIFSKKISKNTKIETGYSVILGSESLEIIKGGNKDLLNHWFYFMITINPTLFKTDKN